MSNTKMPPSSSPEKLLNLRVDERTLDPSLLGLCVGYEQGHWRTEDFARHILEWLPEFALRYSDYMGVSAGNCVQLLRRAAARVYATDKYRKRGEFGEVILHAIIRQAYNSTPAISKLYFIDSANSTVKGFDAVHVVKREPGADFELWLGEAKFYGQFRKAVRDVVAELHGHLKPDYLRGEFLLITPKVDDGWEDAEALKTLLHENTSLDKIFPRINIPVLLTYNSQCIAKHTCLSREYEIAFETEIREKYGAFVKAAQGLEFRIHLFLLPLYKKSELATALHGRLKAMQGI